MPEMMRDSVQKQSGEPRATTAASLVASMMVVMAMAPGQVACADPLPQDQTMLTVDRLFSAKEFDEQDPGLVVWSGLSPAYYTTAASADYPPSGQRKTSDIVRVDSASGNRRIVVSARKLAPADGQDPLVIDGIQLSPDESRILIYTNSQRVWRRKTRGDYWTFDLKTNELKKLGGDAAPSTLMFAKFSPDGSRVAYVRENNLYVQRLDDLRIIPLTTDGARQRINGTADWVNEEELGIRDGYRWSPDGKALAFWQFDTTGVPEFSLIDNTASLYPRITTFPYPKVGQTNSATRLGVVSVEGGGTRWLDIPGDPRQHYLPEMEWSPDSKAIMCQQLNRLQNANLVMVADSASGAVRTVLSEREAAWVESENPVRWAKSGQAFVWLSERDGWRHAYVAATDGSSCALITPGDFDVLEIEAIDQHQGLVYFTASPDNPTQQYLYRVPLGGGNPERLSPADQPGWHSYRISPDAQWAVHTYSTFTSPPTVNLISLGDHRVVRVLADNAGLRAKLAALKLPKAEFFRVDIGDGISLDGWCLLPPALDPGHKHPLLFHVYGEPAGQTVRDSWGGARGLWHWLLAQRGYIVASVDTRGTRVPRGREWRKSVYRQIGIVAPADLAAAARALLTRWPFADPDQVGVWGWSGGGSNTLNAIFRYPELFRTALAVAPNADQLLYDSIYQERYMGSSVDNAEGYRLGSPITHAGNLRGNLLLVHGTGDDNGHYQGTEKLINKLIALRKRFTIMPYPARSHGLGEGDGTVPHFYTLMTDYLEEHLPFQPTVNK